MQLNYKLKIEDPKNHIASVTISGKKLSTDKTLEFYMPCWSPGSYLMREYARNVRCFKALTSKGKPLYFEQVDKATWRVDWSRGDFASSDDEFEIKYEVYCHELTVRTSHIDESHAFIHGPSVFMGVQDKLLKDIELEVLFPALWSKITTGLKDSSTKRDNFLYSAPDFDTFIDSPLEIGCQETDGFRVGGLDHELAWYGTILPNKEDFKADIKKIVELVQETMGGMPYEKYTFISHLKPDLFGGLEHKNSTALQYCPMKLSEKKGYIDWLELVAHEYFHTWNVKRIRPEELGPFNYKEEAMTKMHWLTEGLTSFMDQLFIFRGEWITIEEYLEKLVKNINAYESIPGRRFHSLEDSSFNSWVKLYRPDENSVNSSVSYYLKGGLVFLALHILMTREGKNINDLLKKLWKSYLVRPEKGLCDTEVYKMIEELCGKGVRDKFEGMITTTEEIDFEDLFKSVGCSFEYETSEEADLNIKVNFVGDRVIVSSVLIDGAGFKSGLNAKDEIIAINGLRILKNKWDDFSKYMKINERYDFTVSRLGQLVNISVIPGKKDRVLKEIKVNDKLLVEKCFK